MKGLLLWTGKYGATSDYAHWLAESAVLPVRESGSVTRAELAACDYLVLGTSVYFGKLLLRKWLKKHLFDIREKKLFLFVVCGTPATETETLNRILQVSVPEEIRNRCEVFFLPGRMIRKQLSWADRFAVSMADRLSRNKPEKERIPADYDRVNESALRPLLYALNKYANAEEKAFKELANLQVS